MLYMYCVYILFGCGLTTRSKVLFDLADLKFATSSSVKFVFCEVDDKMNLRCQMTAGQSTDDCRILCGHSSAAAAAVVTTATAVVTL